MYKFLLCVRYLRTRYIALASIISVMLGVATMIVVNSVMAGFSTEMRDRIHGLLADVVVETNSLDGAPDAERLMQIARQAAGDDIDGMTATVEVYGMLSFEYHGQFITRPVTLIGVKPEGKAKVGPLKRYLSSYNELREDDKVVRPALRSEDEPPGWNLTEEALAYRERVFSRQQWAVEGFQGHNPPRTSKDEPDWIRHASAGDLEAKQPESEKNEPPSTFSPPSSDETRDGDSAGSTDSGDDEPAFSEDSPTFAADDSGPPAGLEFMTDDADVTPGVPLDGRVYIGAGLVEFPFTDHETGKTRTMRMVRPGDDVKISTVTAGRPQPARFDATVVDVFKSGMSEYDSNLVFCNLEKLQDVRGMVDPQSGVRSVTSLQIRLKDFNNSDDVVQRLRAAFPPGMFNVQTWEQKQGPLLAAVDVESTILNVLLFLIIAVAGFGILAIFFMIVVEKTRDIGILKALGASSRGVMSVFLSYGLALGIVGSGVGVTLGLLFVKYINQIETLINKVTGRKVFDERIYYFPEIPTHVNASMVVWVACGAILIAVLASILPARRAARLHPVEALRYE